MLVSAREGGQKGRLTKGFVAIFSRYTLAVGVFRGWEAVIIGGLNVFVGFGKVTIASIGEIERLLLLERFATRYLISGQRMPTQRYSRLCSGRAEFTFDLLSSQDFVDLRLDELMSHHED